MEGGLGGAFADPNNYQELKQDLDRIKAAPVVFSGEAKPRRAESSKVGATNLDRGERIFRIVVISAASQAGAQKFVERSKLDINEI